MSKNLNININIALKEEGVRRAYNELIAKTGELNRALHEKTGLGNDFLGWVNLPSGTSKELLEDIKATAHLLRTECEYVVAVGIGGSYLGAKAVVEALSDSFATHKKADGARLLFAGHHISEDYMSELLALLRGHKFGIINISKSGTTTEPAIAFRLLRQLLIEQEGATFAQKHTVAITDAKKGALRTLATEEGLKTYVIPDDVGGRFSVLTPVGLLPIAVAGFDIDALIAGAKDMELRTSAKVKPADNIACQYAATRNALYTVGKKIEILVNFEPKMHYLTEWWKQLYGESEGKEGKGIFPAGVDFSTDLHSMGQWIQDGERTIFETFVSVEQASKFQEIPTDVGNLDGLNFIASKRISYVNKMAEQGTQLAHLEGGVPIIKIAIPQLTEYHIGELFYFFEKAVGISGYLLGVNPFDQPGVEAYKRNMFALLEKPGYEAESKQIKGKVAELE